MMEIKSIKGLIKYIREEEKEYIRAIADGEDWTIYEGLKNKTYETIEKFSDEYIRYSTTEYKYLCDNIYGDYNEKFYRENLSYYLLMDFLEYHFMDSNKFKTFTEFKKYLVESNKKDAYFL